MTTNELICELRDWAEVEGPGSMAAIMSEAADCIEALISQSPCCQRQ